MQYLKSNEWAQRTSEISDTNYEQLEYTENMIVSKLPDKGTRDDREKARENTIRLGRGLWLDETIFSRVRNSFRLSDWSK